MNRYPGNLHSPGCLRAKPVTCPHSRSTLPPRPKADVPLRSPLAATAQEPVPLRPTAALIGGDAVQPRLLCKSMKVVLSALVRHGLSVRSWADARLLSVVGGRTLTPSQQLGWAAVPKEGAPGTGSGASRSIVGRGWRCAELPCSCVTSLLGMAALREGGSCGGGLRAFSDLGWTPGPGRSARFCQPSGPLGHLLLVLVPSRALTHSSRPPHPFHPVFFS